jgi:hypothetical protein
LLAYLIKTGPIRKPTFSDTFVFYLFSFCSLSLVFCLFVLFLGRKKMISATNLTECFRREKQYPDVICTQLRVTNPQKTQSEQKDRQTEA